MDCNPPGSSIHGISQARILEWVAVSFSRKEFRPGIEPRSPALQADSTIWATREAQENYIEGNDMLKWQSQALKSLLLTSVGAEGSQMEGE